MKKHTAAEQNKSYQNLRSTEQIQEDFMSEFDEIKELLWKKFMWTSQVEQRLIKERCDGT